MKCPSCNRVRETLGPDAQWRPVHDHSESAIRPLLECTNCGHRQQRR